MIKDGVVVFLILFINSFVISMLFSLASDDVPLYEHILRSSLLSLVLSSVFTFSSYLIYLTDIGAN